METDGTTSDFEAIEDGDDERDDTVELSRLLADVTKRCEAAGIECEPSENISGGPGLLVGIPAGRTTRRITVWDADRATALLSVDFEHAGLLADYEAVYRPDKVLECAVRPVGIGSIDLLSRRLNPELRSPGPIGRTLEGPLIELSHTLPSGEVKLSLGPPSPELVLFARGPGSTRLSLAIEGLPSDRHDELTTALESVANALFFEIDVSFDTALTLQRPRVVRRTRFGDRAERGPITFPRSMYDREPMSLYWYARGAGGMPLLQYLAYYQCIEFFFPTFAQAEVRKKLSNVAKDPAFDPHVDRHIGRLVDILLQQGRAGLGDERTQLKATLRGCLDAGELREFIGHDDRVAFFDKKIKGLTDIVLKPQLADDELLNKTAERIYEIRCRIVHTKDSGSGEEVGLLLPFSREADQLSRDIELLHEAARRVLVATSRPLAVV
jgi:hypothetical protein